MPLARSLLTPGALRGSMPASMAGLSACSSKAEPICQGATALLYWPAVFGAVVDHVAALAERGEIVRDAVGGVVVQVRTGQHHPRPARPELVAHRSEEHT